MTDSETAWAENKAMGNMAENIVEFLINSTPNWQCIKYGMENHIDELKKLLKSNNEDNIGKRIRSMPDFIAVNKVTNQILLIDVKYRSFIDHREPKTALFGFRYAQIKEYLQFWPEAHLVVVHNHEPFFIVIPLKEIEWYRHFHSRTSNNGNLYEQWNFAGIQKSIKDILPDLPDRALQKAIEMIPSK
ncbi:MAG: hypothetical protein AABW82_02005 [Nanoarchaeota archaeon]